MSRADLDSDACTCDTPSVVTGSVLCAVCRGNVPAAWLKPRPMTFEKACNVVRLTGTDLAELPDENKAEAARELLRERSAKAGWTTEELADEAGRRMKLRIKRMREDEAKR